MQSTCLYRRCIEHFISLDKKNAAHRWPPAAANSFNRWRKTLEKRASQGRHKRNLAGLAWDKPMMLQ
jgi:hypothetical protein